MLSILKMKEKTFILIVFLGSIATGLYFYMYKDHRDISTEKTDYSLSVSMMENEFKHDAVLFNKKYLDKNVEIKGIITQIDLISHAVVIDEKLYAVFKDSILNQLKLKQQVTVKGRFLGYDDLLDEYKLDQVSLVE